MAAVHRGDGVGEEEDYVGDEDHQLFVCGGLINFLLGGGVLSLLTDVVLELRQRVQEAAHVLQRREGAQAVEVEAPDSRGWVAMLGRRRSVDPVPEGQGARRNTVANGGHASAHR